MQRKKVTVYRVSCLGSGKDYIGITGKPLALRWKEHVVVAMAAIRNGALQGAIRKYGAGAFVVSPIYVAVDEREAAAVERGLIASNGTMWPNGYNMSSGGEFRGGHTLSPETKARMRKTALGREIGPSQRDKAVARMKELWADPEYRAMMAKARDTDRFRQTMAQNQKYRADQLRGKPSMFAGRRHSEKSRRAMSEKRKGQPVWNKGLPPTPETLSHLRANAAKQRGVPNPGHSKWMRDFFARKRGEIERRALAEARKGQPRGEEKKPKDTMAARVRELVNSMPSEYFARGE